MPIIQTIFNPNIYRKLFYLGLLVLLISVVGFSIFYLSESYDKLVNWYLGMNECFYKHEDWTKVFFTITVKKQGNLFSIAAIAISLIGITYILLKRRKFFGTAPYESTRGMGIWKWYAAITLLTTSLWYWGNSMIAPSGDEILAAVVCKELPPMQALSYYYLPNNHIYFNFLTGYLTRLTGLDFVTAGRLISLLAQIVSMCLIFTWFAKQFKRKVWAFIAIIPVSLQFLVWGYSFQERGYAFQLLCCWASFLAIIQYLREEKRSALKIYAVFSIIGFALIPTYLYYYAGTVVFVLAWQLYKRKFDIQYWKYQCIIGAGIFILHVPVLLFSGVKMFAGNPDLVPLPMSRHDFLHLMYTNTKFFIGFIFSFLIKENNPINFILFFSPLLLFFTKRKGNKLYASFFVILWLVWIGICLKMGRTCYNRHLVLHNNLTLVMVIYTMFTIAILIEQKFQIAKQQIIVVILFALPVLAFSVHQYKWDKANIGFAMGWEDVNKLKAMSIADLSLIPPHSTIACSDDRYVFHYYADKGPYIVSRCTSGNEDYYISVMTVPLPANIANNYIFLKRGQDNDIYKHK